MVEYLDSNSIKPAPAKPPPRSPSSAPSAPLATMRHLATPQELLEATFRERWRQGWAAVAPELEPYLDPQRRPSGLPIPEVLCANAACRIRPLQ